MRRPCRMNERQCDRDPNRFFFALAQSVNLVTFLTPTAGPFNTVVAKRRHRNGERTTGLERPKVGSASETDGGSGICTTLHPRPTPWESRRSASGS